MIAIGVAMMKAGSLRPADPTMLARYADHQAPRIPAIIVAPADLRDVRRDERRHATFCDDCGAPCSVGACGLRNGRRAVLR